MKTITFREFLRNPKSVLPPPREGIEVTRRNGDSFFIYPKRIEMSDKNKGMSDIMSDKIDVQPTDADIAVEALKGLTETFCQCHWEPVKGKIYSCKLITWEDENGSPIVDKKWACHKCILKYENMGSGHLYFL